MDIFLELMTGGLTVLVAGLIVKLQRITPQLKELISNIELFREKADNVLKMIGTIESIFKGLTEYIENKGTISEEDAKKLIAEGQEIINGPVISDLKKLLEAK